MAADRSQPRRRNPPQPQLAGANVYSTPPLSAIACVTTDPLHQASTAGSKDGGASVPVLHTALQSDPVLTGLQDPFSIMSSNVQIPRDFYPSAPDQFPDYPAFENYPFEPLQGDPQYTLTSSAASVNPRYLDSSVDTSDGVSSHQAGPDPWSHVDITGSTSAIMNQDQAGFSTNHLTTPTNPRRPSSASGYNTFRDSAYATGSRKSQHASEAESTGERHSNAVPQRQMNHTPTPIERPQTSSHSSTVTPNAYSSNLQELEDQPSTPHSHRRPGDLHCRGLNCKYIAKTRSDLK